VVIPPDESSVVTGTGEIESSEVRSSEVRSSEVRSSEVRSSEVRSSEVRSSEVRSSESTEYPCEDQRKRRRGGDGLTVQLYGESTETLHLVQERPKGCVSDELKDRKMMSSDDEAEV
jgi:hypothetical protein